MIDLQKEIMTMIAKGHDSIRLSLSQLEEIHDAFNDLKTQVAALEAENKQLRRSIVTVRESK